MAMARQSGPQILSREAVLSGRDHELLHVQNAQSIADGGVRLIADRYPQSPPSPSSAPAGRITSHSQGREVGRRSPGHEYAARFGRQPGDIRQHPQSLILRRHGAGGLQPRRTLQ